MRVSIFNRSIFLYIAAIFFMSGLVNVKAAQWQRAAYLAGMFTKSDGDKDKARVGVLYFDALTKLAPRDPDSYFNLAVCYYRLGQEVQAVAAYKKAVALGADPGNLLSK